jgi:hypothetical protein
MKLSNQAERAAKEAYYQSLASQLAGGNVKFYADNGKELVALTLSEDMVIASADGFIYRDLPAEEVVGLGEPKTFKAFTSDGDEILSGTIGTAQNLDLVLQDKDKHFYPGMKFGLEEFAFTSIDLNV